MEKPFIAPLIPFVGPKDVKGNSMSGIYRFSLFRDVNPNERYVIALVIGDDRVMRRIHPSGGSTAQMMKK